MKKEYKKIKKIRAPRKLKKKKYFGIIFILILILAGILLYLFILKDLPSPTRLNNPTNIPESSQIFDRNGKLLYTVYSMIKTEQEFL